MSDFLFPIIEIFLGVVLLFAGGEFFIQGAIFLSLILGFFISIPFALARISSIKILSQSVYYYIFVIRGTPLLVQIYLIYSYAKEQQEKSKYYF